MIRFNQRPDRLLYLALSFSLLITGCNPDSSGAKETQQLDNDNDPTAIEEPREVPLSSDNEGTLDENGQFVVIQDFNENDWKKISEDFNLGSVEDSQKISFNTKNSGADAWKAYGGYQYQIVYFSEGGSLKAKPLLRNANNEELEFSTKTIDSLNMGKLWIEIQRSSSNISSNYQNVSTSQPSEN